MATPATDIAVKVGADVAPLQRDLSKGAKSVEDFGKRARAVASDIAKIGAASAAAGAAVVAALVNSARQAIDEQAKLAQRLNTTVKSMGNLERAGDMAGVSMTQISSASRQLDLNLGKAAQGAQSQSKTLDRLGLSAEALAKVPLDQRITKINQAIRDNIPAVERAAVASDLFGQKNASAMMMLSPETMDEAARQAELFGTALDDVDAAKVEQANDALGTIKMAFQGLVKQFTVQVAPVLQAIGDLFLQGAEEAGGLGNKAETAFSKVISAAAFVVNAADGIKRTFSVVSDGIIAALAKVAGWISRIFARSLEIVSKLPGIDYKETAASLREFSKTSQGIVSEAMGNIDRTLQEPMAGDRFKGLVDQAKKASDEMAKATVEARKNAVMVVPGLDDEGASSGGAGDRERERMERRLEAIRDGFRAEEELRTVQYARQVEELRMLHEQLGLSEDQFHKMRKQAEEKFLQDLNAIRERNMTEQERILAMSMASQVAMITGSLGEMFSAYGTHSDKMLKAARVFGATQALISTFQAQAQALKEAPFPANLAAAAKVGAVGLGFVSAIRSAGKGGGGRAAVQSAGQLNQAGMGASSQRETINLQLQGFNRNQDFSGGQMAQVFDYINDRLANGAVLGGIRF
jgi:hypothetical protein